jgi:hypothetical protein
VPASRLLRLLVAAIKKLMHAVVVNDCHIAGFPLVANPVVYFRADPVNDVEDGFVDVTLLCDLPPGPYSSRWIWSV